MILCSSLSKSIFTTGVLEDSYGGFRCWSDCVFRLVSSFRQQWRRVAGAEHCQINCAAHGPVKRAHLQPSGAGAEICTRQEIEISFPPESKAGEMESASPSVIWWAFPSSIEYTKIARR